jgi:hypothetical protein
MAVFIPDSLIPNSLHLLSSSSSSSSSPSSSSSSSGLPETSGYTLTTGLLRSGVSPRVVSDILGHSDVEITLNVYDHPEGKLP